MDVFISEWIPTNWLTSEWGQVALDVIGHVATGVAVYLLVTIRSDRARQSLHSSRSSAPERTTAPTVIVKKIESEYVPLSARDISPMAGDRETQYARNRTEVIRLAGEMLKAGNPPERVADLLPLTEQEMSLVAAASRR